MTLTAQDRARRIKIILFDVDGVLTDGGIWLFPAPAPSSQPMQQQIADLGNSIEDKTQKLSQARAEADALHSR